MGIPSKEGSLLDDTPLTEEVELDSMEEAA
jgi:hypothetical protein